MFQKLGQDIVKAVQRAETQSAATGVKIAKDLSSGGKSLAQLRREDHPFAARHGIAKDPPEIINAQTGEFRSHWRAIAKAVKGIVVPVVENRNWKANFLKDGTKNKDGKGIMLRRPIDSAVGGLLEPVRIENLNRETKKLEAK
jgi:hypothetical protein